MGVDVERAWIFKVGPSSNSIAPLLFLAGVMLLLTACSDEVQGDKPDQGVPDQGKPDLPAYSCSTVIGKPCTKDGDQCGSTAICLLTPSYGGVIKNSGLCTCPCTPDNGMTPLVNEDNCPGASTTKFSVCGTILNADGTTPSYCFKTCQPRLGANDCASPIYCHPSSGAYVGQYSRAVCYYNGGCTNNAHCRVTNGKPCDTQDASKKCTGPGESCRSLTANGTAGMCAVAGVCDTKSGLCDKHPLGSSTASVGDPCKSDLECAGTQTCFTEFDEAKHLAAAGKGCKSHADCCSGSCVSGTCAAGSPCRVRYRNGYCATAGCSFAKTLTVAACDSTSVCNALYAGGLCQKVCDLKTANDCRGNNTATSAVTDYLGDYECRAWNNLSIGGTPVVAKPVCDFGSNMTCDMLKDSSLDCSSVGLSSNPTKMTCRGTDNITKTSKYDSTGLCLDDTASGKIKP